MSARVVRRAYKYRCYPIPEQAGLLNRTFGSVRYVYTRALGAVPCVDPGTAAGHVRGNLPDAERETDF